MSKKLKVFYFIFRALVLISATAVITLVAYCHTIDTGDGWDNFGYRLYGYLIAFFGIPFVIELYSSVKYFIFSDKKSSALSFLHATALTLFLLTSFLSLIALFYFPSDILNPAKGTEYIALCSAILYVTTKFIHLMYFLISKFTRKSSIEKGD